MNPGESCRESLIEIDDPILIILKDDTLRIIRIAGETFVFDHSLTLLISI